MPTKDTFLSLVDVIIRERSREKCREDGLGFDLEIIFLRELGFVWNIYVLLRFLVGGIVNLQIFWHFL